MDCLLSFVDKENGSLSSMNVVVDKVSVPVPIQCKLKVDTVSCGKEHTIVLGRDGQIYTFGSGRYMYIIL